MRISHCANRLAISRKGPFKAPNPANESAVTDDWELSHASLPVFFVFLTWVNLTLRPIIKSGHMNVVLSRAKRVRALISLAATR